MISFRLFIRPQMCNRKNGFVCVKLNAIVIFRDESAQRTQTRLAVELENMCIDLHKVFLRYKAILYVRGM